MPQASKELHAKMEAYFGDAVSELGPLNFLESSGYKLNRNYTWKPKPSVRTYNDMTEKEYDCIKFLVDEWDFGGLETAES